jgi:type I restriction enzyme S subunit
LLVPKLRFKEFDKEWISINFKKILSFKNGINADKDSYGHGIKYISVGDILNNTYITYDKIKGLVDINEKTLSENSVEYGDVVFQRSSETISDIGKANVYLDKEKIATFGGFVIRGKKIGNYNPLFFNYLLKSPYNRKKIIVKGAGAQHYNISQEELEKINVNFTNKKEQEKIANLFSLLDKKIEIQQKKIEALKMYKKGLMQKLFKFEKYQILPLSKIGTIITGTTPSKNINEYWYKGNITWITPTDISENKYIYESEAKLTKNGFKVARYLPTNTLLVTCIGSIGKNAIIKCVGSCNQQINAIIPNSSNDVDFLYYLIEYNKQRLQLIAGISALPIINKSTFEKMKFKIPDLNLQKKISKKLNLLDEKIFLEEKIVKQLNIMKKGLLQQMFI